MVLKVNHINTFIETSHILRDVSIKVDKGTTICLAGRNGAGKTTTLKSVMGIYTPRSGEILFLNREITGLVPHEIAQLGVGYAPEDNGLFADLTVQENIEFPTRIRNTSKTAEERIDLAYSVFPVLKEYRTRRSMQISGGEGKMLSIARAVALDPTLLLLDEPFEGLSPALIPSIAKGLHKITKMGYSILVAESNLYHVPEFTNVLHVIERGEIVYKGSVEGVYEEEEIIQIIKGT